ncbi:2'-deoxycytidine 5'-triphosphate deaminase [Pelagibacterales bacterium SAG-MED31]|nr:2'-deoxycytidine 5'-triphosphate deaminase [Pelagibacterales bacterium SAG-MED31]
MNGSLTFKDYKKLIKNREIISNINDNNKIQPASMDLTLSSECYELKYSFLSPKDKIRNKLNKLSVKKYNLSNGLVFKKNCTYLVRLNEKLNLVSSIKGKCNPKSSTGRLDIFCRTILDKSNEYEKIPLKYKGEMFIEITCKSFNIKFHEGDALNQMRLVFNKSLYVRDNQLKKINSTSKLCFSKRKNIFENGLKLTIDLSNDENICAYKSKTNSPIVNFSKTKFHKYQSYWKPMRPQNKALIIEKNSFYILKSKEKICIPPNLAGEMIPYDTGIGDFRVHYAGFFDPGFGYSKGAFAVLEVKTHEVNFIIEDGQTIARIQYEKLNKPSSMLYGKKINSNYQNQNLTLSKHFI